MAKILLVEDEPNICLLYQQVLEADGHQVSVAYNGKEGVEKALSERPDVVIMDINLPEKMDGIESMSRILSEDKDISVIINTGYSEHKDDFMTWAADAYIVKSGDLTPLKQAIDQVLAKKGGEPPAQVQV